MILETIKRDVSGRVDSNSRIDGNVVIEEGAEIHGSVLRGPLVIGRGMQDSQVVHRTVHVHLPRRDGSELRDRAQHHSREFAASPIWAAGWSEASIGKDVEITKSATMPKAFRFMVGDASRIEVP